jgi:NhaP-type Na+/H+ or K+/H+ antiporter
MVILLPPIIFESALNIKMNYFFKNFGAIIVYALLGTIIACFITASLLKVVSLLNIGPVFYIINFNKRI